MNINIIYVIRLVYYNNQTKMEISFPNKLHFNATNLLLVYVTLFRNASYVH